MAGDGSCETRLKRGQQTAPQYASIRLCYGFPVLNCNTLQHTRTQLRYTSVMVFRYHTAAYCNTLQHTATRCNTLQHAATQCNSDTPLLWFPGIILPHTATCCNTLQLWYASVWVYRYHTATHCNTHSQLRYAFVIVSWYHSATYCSTLQHTATRCNILQHAATHCNTLQHNAIPIRLCYWFPGSYCHALQHAATHCNSDTPLFWFPDIILQHTATRTRNFDTPLLWFSGIILPHTAARCNTLQLWCASVMVSRYHTATYCDTLRHTATHCNFDTLLLRCANKRGSWT